MPQGSPKPRGGTVAGDDRQVLGEDLGDAGVVGVRLDHEVAVDGWEGVEARAVGRVGQHEQGDPAAVQGLGDAVGGLGVVAEVHGGVGQVEADGAGAGTAQGAARGVGAVAEPVGGLEHAVAGRGRDAGLAVHREGGRRRRDADLSRDVGEGGGHLRAPRSAACGLFDSNAIFHSND